MPTVGTLNFRHLRYFWAVARSGSIARASAQLHVTPQSISGQLAGLEESLGVELFRRAGRGLELTEGGRRILVYADEIFGLELELLGAARGAAARAAAPYRVGIADSVPKSLAWRVVEPALRLETPVRLVCREGRLATLLADLAVHRLDIVVADRPIPADLNVRAYNHRLGASDLTIFAATALVAGLISAAASGTVDFRAVTSGSLLFEVILVVVLGGIPLSGGRGGVRNILVGLALVAVLRNGITLMNLSTQTQDMLKGLVLILAIVTDNYLNPRDTETDTVGDL